MRRAFASLLIAFAVRTQAAPATFADNVAPLFQSRCAGCHGVKKQKGGLRLDSHPAILRGGEDGAVVKPGDAAGSELVRRITLPPDDEDFMPSDSKPPLTPSEVALLKAWIAGGAAATTPFDASRFAGDASATPAAPDYRPRLESAQKLAKSLGVALVPRSRIPTDGLVLRTASAPRKSDDAVLAALAPFADLIVDAELARTRVTDKGMESVAQWVNLEHLDLTHTAVTSDGVVRLEPLRRLETLNLTATQVDGRGLAIANKLPAIRTVWSFGTR